MTNTGAEVTEFPLPIDLPPMEAQLVDELPEEPGWQFEPKWDGFRCLAFRAGNEVELRAKSGKPLARYFPEMAAALRGFQVSRFVLDGELAIPVGETFSFEVADAAAPGGKPHQEVRRRNAGCLDPVRP